MIEDVADAHKNIWRSRPSWEESMQTVRPSRVVRLTMNLVGAAGETAVADDETRGELAHRGSPPRSIVAVVGIFSAAACSRESTVTDKLGATPGMGARETRS